MKHTETINLSPQCVPAAVTVAQPGRFPRARSMAFGPAKVLP